MLLPAAALAQTAPPVTVPRTETLRLQFKSGETLYYRLVEDTDGSYREPGGKLTPIKSHLDMQMHQTTTERRDADGAGMIGFGIDLMTVTVDKKPTDSTSDPVILANLAALVVLPSGKITDTLVNSTFNADESLPGEDPAHMNALAGLGELPPTPVKIGSVWKGSVFLGLVGEKTEADLSLIGWETKDTATVAVIKQTLKGSFSTSAASAAPPPRDFKAGSDAPSSRDIRGPDMKIAGWTAGTRTVRLNVDSGIVESQESVVWVTVFLTPKNEDGRFAGTPIRMWVKVTSKMTRTAAPDLKKQNLGKQGAALAP